LIFLDKGHGRVAAGADIAPEAPYEAVSVPDASN
jgi:hypothetical protein